MGINMLLKNVCLNHSPVRLAIMLLLQYPHLAAEITLPTEFNTLSLPGIPILLELYQCLKDHPQATTGDSDGALAGSH